MPINKIPQSAFSNDDMIVNTFTATAGQTAFTLTKKVSLNAVLVHVNDVIQQPTADYTVGSSPNENILTFTSGLTVGDDVRIRILSENPLGSAGGGGSGISLAQARAGISVTTTSASGGGTLSYNNTTGVLTFAPSTNTGGGGGGGIALGDLSVGTEGSALGNGAIAYNNSTGVFTYTPPLLNGLTANGTTDFGSNKITYSNNYANLADLPSPSTYHGMFAHVHAVGAAYYAHAGAWVRLADHSQLKTDLASLDNVSSTAPSSGQVLKWSGSEWAPAADATGGGGGGGIALTDISASNASASGGGSLAYNNSTGAFTFTPPALSGVYATVASVPYVALPDDQEFGVTASGSSAYTFTGGATGNNPTLTLQRGKTYRFDVNASGHPFQIRVSSGGSNYTNGVENAGTQSGAVYFTVPDDAPSSLVYQCSNHSAMVGTINIIDKVVPGHVIQTQYVMSTTRTQLTTTSYAATALQKAITPIRASSWIYIQVMTGHNTERAGERVDLTIQRGAFGGTSAQYVHEISAGGITGLSGSTGRLNTEKYHAGRGEGSTILNFLDVAHNSTLSRTYHVVAKGSSGSAIEIPSSSTQIQLMVLQEIAQ